MRTIMLPAILLVCTLGVRANAQLIDGFDPAPADAAEPELIVSGDGAPVGPEYVGGRGHCEQCGAHPKHVGLLHRCKAHLHNCWNRWFVGCNGCRDLKCGCGPLFPRRCPPKICWPWRYHEAATAHAIDPRVIYQRPTGNPVIPAEPVAPPMYEGRAPAEKGPLRKLMARAIER